MSRGQKVRIKVLGFRVTLTLLFLYFTLGPLVWAADESSGTARKKRATQASSPSKKKIQEPAKRSKKEVRRSKKGDTVPMPPLTDAPFPSEVQLLPILKEAKRRLSHEKVSYFTPDGRPAKRELKLAIADFTTGRIRIVSGQEENQGLYLNDSNVRFSVHWWNGFNSSIDILEPPNTAVVGLLYALDPNRRSALRRDAVIYTPFSRALLQPELIDAGREYLNEKISQSRRELRHVKSRAQFRTPLEEGVVFKDGDYFNLILAEHMDPGSFRAITGDQLELEAMRERRLMRLINRILVIIGSNREDAYKFTGNYASARGLTQFTPIGMRVVWNKYTEADISTDFLEATADHLFAIKAEICLLDHYLSEVLRVHPSLSGSGYEKYAAGACYNGGPKNVFYGLKNFGMSWLYPMRRLAELSNRRSLTAKERRELEWLKKNRDHETFIYLNKMHAIERLQPHQTRIQSPPREPVLEIGSPTLLPVPEEGVAAP
jgi:hypothetical protein